MAYVLLALGYIALIGYIVYQAVMLDTYRKWNEQLRLEVILNKPPF
jgi:hypothetical protein